MNIIDIHTHPCLNNQPFKTMSKIIRLAKSFEINKLCLLGDKKVEAIGVVTIIFQDFISYIHGNSHPVVSSDDAIRSTETTLLAQRSAELKERIKIRMIREN